MPSFLDQLKHLFHPRRVIADAVSVETEKMRSTKREHKLGAIQDNDFGNGARDPLNSRHLTAAWNPDDMLSVTDFPNEGQLQRTGDRETGPLRYVGDGKSKIYTADSITGSGGQFPGKASWNAYAMPEALIAWYTSQSFIGYQTCAIVAQHWLVDKCCTMPGADAVRNGYQVTIKSDAVEGDALDSDETDEIIATLSDLDDDFNIHNELIQFYRFTQIYGIRVCVFDVESDDPQYYEKPFNIDGVKEGSYKGIRQIDPYWMMPVLSGAETSDPTDPNFYDPSYWVISGKKYHRSHLIVGRGPEPADILKPAYIFGGIPLTQRIYERVYAAERTANEGPLLAVTKRTTVLKTNLALAEAQPNRFMARIMKWTEMRDNYGVKTVNTDDNVEQHDTSLADLDSVIMTQYQLVASIAEVPATKLLGTSPKGFNATGEHETKSYHEKLESVQKFLTPLLTRHHELLCRSEFGRDLPIKHTWNRVDSFTALELAQLNFQKAQTAAVYANDVAAISPDEVRTMLKNDALSGYQLTDDTASEQPGDTPENEATETGAQAQQTTAAARSTEAAKKPEEDPDGGPDGPGGVSTTQDDGQAEVIAELADIIQRIEQSDTQGSATQTLTAVGSVLEKALAGDQTASSKLKEVLELLKQIDASFRSTDSTKASVNASVKPSVKASVKRTGDTNQIGLPSEGDEHFSHKVLPERKFSRLTLCVECPQGTVRSGVDSEGTKWRSHMAADYGFIKNTVGADGHAVDVFIGPRDDAPLVWIINQNDPVTGKFDEHKVMIGFHTEQDAHDAYTRSYTEGWQGLHSIHGVPMIQFREWLREADLTQPYRK